MNTTIAEQKRAEAIQRIAGALERIAQGVERYADADPMTVLHEAMQGGEWGEAPGVEPSTTAEPREPFASNGATVMYRHPDSRYEIVLRRDPAAESGYVAMIEEV